MGEVVALKSSKDDLPLEEVLSRLLDDVREGRAQAVGIIWRRAPRTEEEKVISDAYIENFWLSRSVHELVGLLENFKLEIIEKSTIRG